MQEPILINDHNSPKANSSFHDFGRSEEKSPEIQVVTSCRIRRLFRFGHAVGEIEKIRLKRTFFQRSESSAIATTKPRGLSI